MTTTFWKFNSILLKTCFCRLGCYGFNESMYICGSKLWNKLRSVITHSQWRLEGFYFTWVLFNLLLSEILGDSKLNLYVSESDHQRRTWVQNVCSRWVVRQMKTKLNKAASKYVSKISSNTKRETLHCASYLHSDSWLFLSCSSIWRVRALRLMMSMSKVCAVGVVNSRP